MCVCVCACIVAEGERGETSDVGKETGPAIGIGCLRREAGGGGGGLLLGRAMISPVAWGGEWRRGAMPPLQKGGLGLLGLPPPHLWESDWPFWVTGGVGAGFPLS